MKKIIERIILTLLAFNFLVSCQPNDDETPILVCPAPTIPQMCEDPFIKLTSITDTCFALPISTGGTIIGLQEIPPSFGYADFNPNNPNEFVYLFAEAFPSSEGKVEVRKVNICSGEEFILDGYIGTQRYFDYGPNEWIVFDGQLELTIVKSNGDSLARIRDYCGGNPFWIWEGDAILCPEFLNTLEYSSIVDESGMTIDTIPRLSLAAYRNKKIVKLLYLGGTDFTFALFDLPTKEMENIVDFPIDQFGTFIEIDWLNDNEIVFAAENGLYTLDLTTKEFSTIKEHCQNSVYLSVSSSPLENGDVLLYRREYRYTSQDSITWFRNISLLNIYSSEEYIIELEE
jgi:hypothetical protein